MAPEGSRQPNAAKVTEKVIARLESTRDARLRALMEALVRHLHTFAVETQLTEAEWEAGISFLTDVGHWCSDTRQEMILLSDTLGLSMVVDATNHPGDKVTESTVRGPFYVIGSPERPMGSSIAEDPGSGDPAVVSGRVLDEDGHPIAGALLDVWQNASNRKYAVQDGGQSATNLRGRFRTGTDGRYEFWSVRPTDYPIPDDGPVGAMLRALGRHPWRPAHLHLIVSAPGHHRVTTHFYDDGSRYLDSDAVFGVKESLVCHFERHEMGEPGVQGAPLEHDGPWYSLERDVVLLRDLEAPEPGPVDDSGYSKTTVLRP